MTEIAIGICTHRRPEVAECLAALARLDRPEGTRLHVIVADNDAGPSGEEAVRKAAAALPFETTYLHAPAHNISIARNAILDEAARRGADLLAFIDDDETATPGWLAALLAAQRATGCAAVVGPVAAAYGDGAPAWMRAGRVHDTRPDMRPDGTAHTGYTCNLLIDLADPRIAPLRFDAGRGRSGGEDTAFLTAYQRAGGRIAFAADALVEEEVPPGRATLGWLLTRRYRMGQTHGQLIAEGRGVAGRLGQAVLAAAKAGYCGAAFLGGAFDPLRRNRALMRGALHIGAISGSMGARAIEIYGTAPAASVERRG